MRGRGALGGRGIRTADATGGSSCHPLDRSHELSTAVPERIGGPNPVFPVVCSHGGVHFVPRHVLVIDSHAHYLAATHRAREELKPLTLLVDRRARPRDEAPRG